MKLFKIEIQITLLTIFIGAAVIGSGYLVYKSLSEIIDSIHKEARPDYKLLLIKDIASELSEVENSVRLFSLTGNENFIYKFHKLNKDVQEKLVNLEDYAIPGSEEIQRIDSIQYFTKQKLVLWSQIRNLHQKKLEVKPTTQLTELRTKIDSTIIQPDTITFEKPETKGFFKRLFGKKDTTTKAPIIIDKTEEKEQLKQELAEIEEQMSTANREYQSQEKRLLEQNIYVTNQINRLIGDLESSEQKRLQTKTAEADYMAAQIYRRLFIFTGASIILLFIVLILFYRNLQRNKAYQNMLKKARVDAENLAKAKERFVATVSHEMRTPVNAIFGLSEQMLQRVGDPSLKSDLNIVNKSADHLITLVNDTLDFSKMESQKMTFEKIDFIPTELFSEIITLHEVPARKKDIQLELINNIPAERVYKGDPVRLKQILINLFTNAIKFTDKGKVTLETAEEKSPVHGYRMVVDVIDSGVGIPKDNLDKIFDEFVQLEGENSQRHRGAGLGLAIVKKLVELQNGSITVKSIVGKGTRFTLEIPYEGGNPEKYKKPEPEGLQIPDWFQDLHLLLVDDEDFNLYLLKNILDKWKIRFSEAHNGLQAVEKCTNEHFNLILMDKRMPVMNGFEASKKILQHNPQASIVILTATNQTEEQEEFNKSGILGFLQKPFPERALFELILNLKDRITTSKVKEPATVQENIFRPQELLENLGGDEQFFKEMVDLFIKSAQNSQQAMQHKLQQQDWEGLSDAAHKLASPSKHMLANQLYSKLKELEKAADKNEDWKLLAEMVKNVNEQIKSYLQQIEQTSY